MGPSEELNQNHDCNTTDYGVLMIQFCSFQMPWPRPFSDVTTGVLRAP